MAPLALLAACGGGGGSSGQNPTPTPTPAPTPSPTASPTPTPAGIVRLQQSLLSGRPPAENHVSVSTTTQVGASQLATMVLIQPDDPRIRILGGRHSRGATYPRSEFLNPQVISPTGATVDSAGFAYERYGLLTGFEFVLPAGSSRFEVLLFDSGGPGNLILEIDGARTNAAGYADNWGGSGNLHYTLFELPPSNSARAITIRTAGRPFGGLRLDGGATIASAPAAWDSAASVVFVGDSITEGTGASHPVRSWASEAAYRLGIDGPIISAVGGTGYLRRRGENNNFSDRIADVLTAVDGGPPDAVVVAGGINDCDVYSAADIGSAARQYFEALRSGAPAMPIIVIGPFARFDQVPYSSQWLQCRDAIFSSAATVPGVYTVDVSSWLTNENRYWAFDEQNDVVHPNDAGHLLYGDRAADAIRAIISGL